MELAFFRRFICENDNSDGKKISIPTKAELSRLHIQDQSDRAGEAILAHAAVIERDESLVLYIRGMQLRIVSLSNRLWGEWMQLPKGGERPYPADTCDALQEALELLLDMLACDFPQHSNPDSRISLYRQSRFIKQLKSFRGALGKLLKEAGDDGVLAAMLCAKIDSVLRLPPVKAISWRDELYWTELIEEVMPIIRAGGEECAMALSAVLCRRNFNLPEFMRYVTQKGQEEIDAADSGGEKRKVVQRLLQDALYLETGGGLIADAPSVAEALRMFGELHLRLPGDDGLTAIGASMGGGKGDEAKIRLGMSVAQFACFIASAGQIDHLSPV